MRLKHRDKFCCPSFVFCVVNQKLISLINEKKKKMCASIIINV